MTKNFINKTNEQFEDEKRQSLTLEEFLEQLEENPQYAAESAQYLLNAIEYYGTRTVIEEGEEKERYRFFDNPAEKGKHAVLGNTDLLNEFVDDLRLMAEKNTKNDKILWFDGPTATGKSELKRCLISGLRAYSKTDAGKRFTMEWNVSSRSNTRDLSYGAGAPHDTEDDWYMSPVQDNPLKVFPQDIRRDISESYGTSSVSGDLDPFSRETYDMLRDHYEKSSDDDIFENMVDEKHLRVRSYTMDVGSGIGVLHSEDDGTPKQRLIGHWMQGMLQQLNTRGRKNPHAFSYDGVLSQGNGGVTIFEDASQHMDVLSNMLNIAEENMVKLDKKIEMDIDTVLMVISNPDLEFSIRQQEGRENMDPMKALRRRLSKHKFKYLTELSSEVQLLRREIAGERGVEMMDDESKADPLFLDGVEIARHTLEVAAMYSVLTRLNTSETPHGLTNVEKILLLDNGHIYKDGKQYTYDDFDISNSHDGETGIPVTYTRDIISQISQEEDIVTPSRVLDEMQSRLSEEPLFSSAEKNKYTAEISEVNEYKTRRIESDVLSAMMRDKRVEEEKVRRYVDMVYEWSAGNDDEYDPLEMKVFETRHFGRFDESDYNHEIPLASVKEFREDEVIKGVNNWVRNRATDNHDISDVNHKEVPVFRSVLENHDWADVKEEYENFEPQQWGDPPSDTQTEMLKEKTIQNMVDMYDYTEESAERASVQIIKDVEV